MTDSNSGDNPFDLLDRAVDFYEDNKEMIKGIAPTDNGVTIDDEDPLKKAIVEDDEVVVTVDVGTDEIGEIKLDLDGSTARVGVGGKTVTANVPDDVIMDDAEAVLNNMILEVKIPREGGGD